MKNTVLVLLSLMIATSSAFAKGGFAEDGIEVSPVFINPEIQSNETDDSATADEEFGVISFERSDVFYGGFIKNRRTKERIGLKCAQTSGRDCIGWQFYKVYKTDSTPPTLINDKVIFKTSDIQLLQDAYMKKMKFRIIRSTIPDLHVFGLTMIVTMLKEQNQTGGGKKLPIGILYGISVPIDVATMIPIALVDLSVWGTRLLVAEVARVRVNKAFKHLQTAGSTKTVKLSRRNFKELEVAIQQYRN